MPTATDLSAAALGVDACRNAVRTLAEAARRTEDELLKLALVQAALRIHDAAEKLDSVVRRAERERRAAGPSPDDEAAMFRAMGGV